ncbi:hypothetical protein [Hydrogenimonas sp.]
MKYIIGLIALVAALLVGAYGLLFTQPGNDILKPVIEKKVAAQVPLPTKLETFVLRPDRFEVVLQVGKDTRIEAKGSMDLMAQRVDATYDVDIEELANLKKLIGADLHGPFRTHGTVKGDKKAMAIDGESDLAGSATGYHLKLRDFEPDGLKAKVAHLHIDKLLHMVGQPLYAEGLVDVDADIPGLDIEHLDGTVVTKITKGLVHSAPVKRDFNLSIPSRLTFHGDIDTRLKETKAISKVDFVTSIATLATKALVYDIKKGELATDYRLRVPNLDRLYFVTNQHMKGDINVTGDVEAGKKGFTATAHSDTLGGAVDAKVANNDVKVRIKNIQTVALTDMLLYPHIFDSRANMELDYDTLTKKGELHARLLDGQILPNKMSFMLQQLANFDITREVYELTTLDTKIDDKLLVSDLHMKSKLTEIDAKQAKVDLDKQTIDATIDVKIRKTFIPVRLSGKLTDPDIKIDSKGLIKEKAKQELEKHLPDNVKNSPAGGLLKNFF